MILNLDCRHGLAMLPDNSVHAVVCDPPYEIGFMGKSWDSTGVAFDPATWRECLRMVNSPVCWGFGKWYSSIIDDAVNKINTRIQVNHLPLRIVNPHFIK